MRATARRRPASTASSSGSLRLPPLPFASSGRSSQKEVEFRPATPLGLAERGDVGCEIAKAGPVVVRIDGAGLH